jgi:hypothetical protein
MLEGRNYKRGKLITRSKKIVKIKVLLFIFVGNNSKIISKKISFLNDSQKVAINRAANALIHESLLREGRSILYSVFPATIVFLLIFSVGFIAGISIPSWIDGVLGGGYTKVQSTNLTWKELEAMKWAISSEGKFAKNLINWNRGYLENGECLKDAQKLGVVLSQYNRKASSGFCTVWVTSIDKRRFEEGSRQ